MTSPVRRAAVFAAICTLSLAVPLFGTVVGAALAAVVLLGAFTVTDGPLFDLLAYPGDYEDNRLYGLITFVLAGVALGIIAVSSSMSIAVFVGTVFLIGYGNVAEQIARTRTENEVVVVTVFCLAATSAAVIGHAGTLAIEVHRSSLWHRRSSFSQRHVARRVAP